MLSNQEKKEMLDDARSVKRRESFRQAQVRPNHPTYDAYLKFLSCIHKVFQRAEDDITKTPKAQFKL